MYSYIFSFKKRSLPEVRMTRKVQNKDLQFLSFYLYQTKCKYNYFKRKKNTIKLLNEAVNQLERADVVLMKTLAKLSYFERMEAKKKYEEVYETVFRILKTFFYQLANLISKQTKKDLKKGLTKVMDKQFEPLIQALLTDSNTFDVDRIYESLYDLSDAALTITESLISRNLEQKSSLLLAFHQSKIIVQDSYYTLDLCFRIEILLFKRNGFGS
jgi:hypothetical protein